MNIFHSLLMDRSQEAHGSILATLLLTVERQTRIGCAQLVGSHTSIVAEVLLCHIGNSENGSCAKILNNNSLLAIEEPGRQNKLQVNTYCGYHQIFILDGVVMVTTVLTTLVLKRDNGAVILSLHQQRKKEVVQQLQTIPVGLFALYNKLSSDIYVSYSYIVLCFRKLNIPEQ